MFLALTFIAYILLYRVKGLIFHKVYKESQYSFKIMHPNDLVYFYLKIDIYLCKKCIYLGDR